MATWVYVCHMNDHLRCVCDMNGHLRCVCVIWMVTWGVCVWYEWPLEVCAWDMNGHLRCVCVWYEWPLEVCVCVCDMNGHLRCVCVCDMNGHLRYMCDINGCISVCVWVLKSTRVRPPDCLYEVWMATECLCSTNSHLNVCKWYKKVLGCLWERSWFCSPEWRACDLTPRWFQSTK
jgi:hypothetical protein